MRKLAFTEREEEYGGNREYNCPYERLIVAIIISAIDDKDVEFLQGKQFEKYCALLNADKEEFLTQDEIKQWMAVAPLAVPRQKHSVLRTTIEPWGKAKDIVTEYNLNHTEVSQLATKYGCKQKTVELIVGARKSNSKVHVPGNYGIYDLLRLGIDVNIVNDFKKGLTERKLVDKYRTSKQAIKKILRKDY